jgi:hypothetical protein
MDWCGWICRRSSMSFAASRLLKSGLGKRPVGLGDTLSVTASPESAASG